jgi:hypothetical protein
MQRRPAHLGYLIGYDSRNIYRIWILSRGKVIRARDVKFDHNAFWMPDDLDIGDVLREADLILDALNLPGFDAKDIADNDEVLDFIVVDHPANGEASSIKDASMGSND